MVLKAGVAIGAVGLAIGLAIAFGVVPLAAACTSGCSNGATVQFTYSVSGLTLKVTDDSTIPSGTNSGVCPLGYTLYDYVWSWGVGGALSNVSYNTLGQSATHTYAMPGTYSVSETMTYACGSVVLSTTSAEAIAVGGGSGGGGSVSVQAAFSTTTGGPSGLTVFLTDKSTISVGAAVTGATVNWGDGTVTTETTIGFSASHVYSTKGIYSVGETVTWVSSGSTHYSAYTSQVDVGNLASSSYGEVNASFNASVTGLAVTIHDTSVPSASPAPNVSGVQIAWGDGTVTSAHSLGFTLYHVYATNGTYRISETVSWVGPAPDTSVAQKTVVMAAPLNYTTSTAPETAHASYPFWSALSGFLIIGFLALLISSLVAGTNLPAVGVVTGAGMAAGAILGYLVGKTWV